MRSHGFAGFAILVWIIGACLGVAITLAVFALLRTSGHLSYNGGVVGIMGVVFAIVGFGMGIFAIFYSPGPPSYTVTPESLTFHDRFYPVTLTATSVDVQCIRVVDLDVDTDWQPTICLGGFSNPHYRCGRFLVDSGKIVRIYQVDSRRLVLLPPKNDDTAVLVETREPEIFVDEVRRNWNRHS